jgi:predicted glycosyltransferase
MDLFTSEATRPSGSGTENGAHGSRHAVSRSGLAHSRPRRSLRVALYSHDTMGLGHIRRNVLIAQSLVESGRPVDVLLLAGVREAGALPIPRGVDCISLPAYEKRPDGVYGSRHLAMPVGDLVSLRSRTLEAAVEGYRPDVLVVDNVPLGAMREMEPALQSMRRRAGARCVLGLRDILDEPRRVRAEWGASNNEAAIRTYYDSLWVYGDRRVCDVAQEYGLAADVAKRIRYAGYLDQSVRCDSSTRGFSKEIEAVLDFRGRVVLCSVGGGQDGRHLARAFVSTAFPPDTLGVLLTGPYMEDRVRDELARLALENGRLNVFGFLPEPGQLVRRADRIIAMGGYNTVCEVLSYGKRALIVPRLAPRQEQWIRAERLRALGLIDVLHPDSLTPEALAAWIASRVDDPAGSPVDLGGLSRIPLMLEELFSGAARQSVSAAQDRGASYVFV